mmetsp:Transcript_1638/g.3743  ORF Transcript_1638/g.3743 Transcript_1638/m.3743 type:complete len:227 (+) Transcript_1638:919-1599(+)
MCRISSSACSACRGVTSSREMSRLEPRDALSSREMSHLASARGEAAPRAARCDLEPRDAVEAAQCAIEVAVQAAHATHCRRRRLLPPVRRHCVGCAADVAVAAEDVALGAAPLRQSEGRGVRQPARRQRGGGACTRVRLARPRRRRCARVGARGVPRRHGRHERRSEPADHFAQRRPRRRRPLRIGRGLVAVAPPIARLFARSGDWLLADWRARVVRRERRRVSAQ